MSNETWLQSKIRDVAGRVGYELERFVVGINEQIVAKMETEGLTRAELATRMKVDKAQITRMLNGSNNVTVKTLVSAASALGCRFTVPQLVEIAEKKPASVAPVVRFMRPVSRTTSAEFTALASHTPLETASNDPAAAA